MSFTTNVQWKGTDLCMDFNCPACGEFSHFDGMFAYVIRCPHCKALYRMPAELPIVKIDALPDDAPFLEGEA